MAVLSISLVHTSPFTDLGTPYQINFVSFFDSRIFLKLGISSFFHVFNTPSLEASSPTKPAFRDTTSNKKLFLVVRRSTLALLRIAREGLSELGVLA